MYAADVEGPVVVSSVNPDRPLYPHVCTVLVRQSLTVNVCWLLCTADVEGPIVVSSVNPDRPLYPHVCTVLVGKADSKFV
jgi:hypothetical protein